MTLKKKSEIKFKKCLGLVKMSYFGLYCRASARRIQKKKHKFWLSLSTSTLKDLDHIIAYTTVFDDYIFKLHS